MPTCKLFEAYTWRRTLPKPFDDSELTRTDVYSKYNTTSTKRSTFHAATLSGILAYIEVDIRSHKDPTSADIGAIGTQNDMIIAEYPNHKGENHAIVFNRTSGAFIAGCFSSPTSTAQAYILNNTGNSGSALFFAMMPAAMEDDEFAEYYSKLYGCADNGYPDLEQAGEYAIILCDNFYRRIENARMLGDDGIKTKIPAIGNLQILNGVAFTSGIYSPTTVLHGNFQIFTPGMAPAKAGPEIKHDDFVGKYQFSERTFTDEEKSIIPDIPSWYVIPPQVATVCEHALKTTGTNSPMRNFLFRGSSGTGKTEAAKAIAAGLNLPYKFLTCSSDTEKFDLTGQLLPCVEGMTHDSKVEMRGLPKLEDFIMDPGTAYEKLTGKYDDSLNGDAVFKLMLDLYGEHIRKEIVSVETSEGQRFQYVDSELIDAVRYGYVIELQEPSVIQQQGVLVGLNGLLDRCSSIQLATGEIVHRHPDTVFIMTTNNDYVGCKPLNQSILSRMSLIIDFEDLNTPEMIKRVSNITGCKDEAEIEKMATAMEAINTFCRDNFITDGSCGMRELIAWVQSYMIIGSALESAKYTVLASVTSDLDNRANIETTCIRSRFAA